MKKICLLLSVSILLVFTGAAFFAAPSSCIDGGFAFAEEADEALILRIEELIEGIIDWKKTDVNAEKYGNKLLSAEFLENAGSTAGDWFPFAMGRYGYTDDYDAYLAVVSDNVSERYTTADKLSRYKATEWHRIALAVSASGGNPRAFGQYEGLPIDLIADGTYNRGYTASCGKQGINGWIWGLLALDSKAYAVPENAFSQRGDFIVEIISKQLSDGGFALSGSVSDPDITAMAIQALAPYYNSQTVYSYTSSTLKDEEGSFVKVSKSVRQVVDEALLCLSSVQAEDGSFSSWGTVNLESACQVLVALCSLDINPLTDTRFIKNGNTLLDVMLRFRLSNGGFVHSFVYDPDNPTSKPDEANTMASEQACYSFVALWRKLTGRRALYDLRDEFTSEERELINSVGERLALLSNDSSYKDIQEALEAFLSVNAFDVRYVKNYNKLVEQCERVGIAIPENEELKSGSATGENEVILYFSESDRASADSIAATERLTTEYYTEIVRLRYVLEKCDDFSDKEDYVNKVEALYVEVKAILNEIDSINEDITLKLHPFENIGLKDKETIDSIIARIDVLSEYDKTKITHTEDLLKAKTQVDNLLTALIIAVVLAVIASVLVVVVIKRIKVRRALKKAAEMEESCE